MLRDDVDGEPRLMASPSAIEPELVPPWLARFAALGWRALVTIALAFVLIQVALVLGTVTTAIAIGLIVAATFSPYVRRLRARGWARIKAAAIVSLLALGSLAVLIAVLVWAFWPYLDQLLAAIQSASANVSDQIEALGLPPALTDVVHVLLDEFRKTIVSIGAQIAGPIASFVTALILGAFLTFFLLLDGDRAWRWLMDPIKGWRAETITAKAVVALERVGGYLRGTAILAAVRAVSAFIFLTVLGVPLAAPLSVLIFLCAFVPYVGGLFATAVALVVTYSSVGGTATLVLFLLIGTVNLILGRLLGPVVYGRNLNVHPALVLIALPAGYALFGAVGLFVALPVVAAAIAIVPAVIAALGDSPLGDGPGGVSSEEGVPVWLDRLGQWSWRGLIIVGILAVLVAVAVRIPIVVLPVVLAIVLAATLDPTADALRRRGWSRGRAAIAVTVGTIVAIVGVSALAIIAMIGPMQEMLGTATDGASTGILANLGVGTVVKAVASGMVAQIADIVAGVSYLAIVLLLAALLTFYFLRDGDGIWGRVVARLDRRRRPAIGTAGSQAVRVLGGYMIGTGVVSLFGAATTALIMWLLGLPLVLPIAVLSFFLGFIPYIGSFVATFLAFLVTVSVGSTTDIVIMAVFTIVFNIAQGNFVAPLVYGRTVSLHPAIVLLAIPAGAAVAGMVGMFLVVPFLGVVAVTWRTLLHQFDEDAPLLAEEAAPPAPPPDADVVPSATDPAPA